MLGADAASVLLNHHSDSGIASEQWPAKKLAALNPANEVQTTQSGPAVLFQPAVFSNPRYT